MGFSSKFYYYYLQTNKQIVSVSLECVACYEFLFLVITKMHLQQKKGYLIVIIRTWDEK